MKDNFCRKKEQKFSCRCCLFCYFIEAKKKKIHTENKETSEKKGWRGKCKAKPRSFLTMR